MQNKAGDVNDSVAKKRKIQVIDLSLEEDE